ncbi:DUF488 domain-containing protein [Xanthomonas translucens]|uniref:DNA repair protein n=3 Tax=Xanthomonas campestris pv. translucens TaxID=343 RepID=A0A120EYQ5_XANCT|nr:DUF488 domain-containing protein [Xanthomonas translucens]AKK69460.1 hypothetical protein FD63_19335 [Xanthomonas translucens pv. undulosa]AVY68420.1 hypothetical protein NZ30_19495 [Xanthomonas translucens pv. undulosa]ELQ07236.1 hypothetical protein A989_11199 [Xanthomonas translucens DAR61454]KTF41352.1 hypothetical protein OZ12_02105 [Xanthomonas translucens pv. translucens]KWV14798.1 hypothetical protein ATB54_11280 [Xanthomonas translucens]
MSAATFFSVGHSTRPLQAFLDILHGAQVAQLADVRAFPWSRRFPQFDGRALARSLAAAGIGYRHFRALGGRRGKQPGIDPQRNGHWHSAGFHHYADYALGADFGAALAELRALGSVGACAVMCAEADWRQCHRQIVCDHLLHHGHPVIHLIDGKRREPAVLNPAARSDAHGQLVYPADVAPAGPVTGDLFGG